MIRLLAIFVAMTAWVLAQAVMQECGSVQSALGGKPMTLTVVNLEGKWMASIAIGRRFMPLTSSQLFNLRGNWRGAIERIDSLSINEGQTNVLAEEASSVRYSSDRIGVGATKTDAGPAKIFWFISNRFGNDTCVVKSGDFSKMSWAFDRACAIASGQADPGAFPEPKDGASQSFQLPQKEPVAVALPKSARVTLGEEVKMKEIAAIEVSHSKPVTLTLAEDKAGMKCVIFDICGSQNNLGSTDCLVLSEYLKTALAELEKLRPGESQLGKSYEVDSKTLQFGSKLTNGKKPTRSITMIHSARTELSETQARNLLDALVKGNAFFQGRESVR